MRRIIIFMFILLLAGIFSCAQTNKSNKNFTVQNGLFICRLNDCIIYSNTEHEDEYPLYNLYSLDPITNNKRLIDSLVTLNCWIKTSDSTLVYSKSDKLYLWNSNTKAKTPFPISYLFVKIIGIGFNRDLNYLILFDLDKKKQALTLTILDKFNYIKFKQMIEFNEIEMEGILPKIEAINNYFVFLIQDKLYMIDLSKKNPDFNIISDKCDGFALFEDKGIIFYKFISDEKTNGYIIYHDGLHTNIIDNLLNEKIFNCGRSDLITAKIMGKFVPIYVICDSPYIFSESKWEFLQNIVIYEDEKLIVKIPYYDGKVNKDSFEWYLKGL